MTNKTENLDQLHLEKITWDNVDSIINLHVNKEQRDFVAANKDSFVDACVRMICIPFRFGATGEIVVLILKSEK